MKKYFHIILGIMKNNLVREMEFRANFLLSIVIQLSYLALQILIVQVLFQYTSSINGWSRGEVFLIFGIFRVVRGVFDFFIYANLVNLPNSIGKGELDYIITKPVNALFLSSFRKHQYSEIMEILSGIGFIIYSLQVLMLPATLVIFFELLFVLILGVIGMYSLMLLISTLAFFTTRLNAISSFYDVVGRVSRYPANILFGDSNFSYLLVPITVIATVPAQIILGKPIFGGLFGEVGAIFMIILAIAFWNFALKKYTSASS